MNFPKLIFAYAALLIIDSLVFQYFANIRDISLMTPIVFAGFILIMGIMSVKQDLALFGRHGATAVSLIAFITSITSIFTIIFPGDEAVALSEYAHAVMALLSLAFIALAVHAFAAERGEKEPENDVE